MTEADLRLKAIFAADAPPAVDPTFALGVLHAVERRRLIVATLVNAALAIAAGGLLWAVWPMVAEPVARAWPSFAPAAGIVAAALVSLALMEKLAETERRNAF